MKLAPVAFVKAHPVTTVAAVAGGVLLILLMNGGSKSQSNAQQVVGASGPSDAVIAAQTQGYSQTLAYNAATNQLAADTSTKLAETYAARDVALASVEVDSMTAQIAGQVAMYTVGTEGAVATYQSDTERYKSDNELAGVRDTNATINNITYLNTQVQHAALNTQQLYDSYHRNDNQSSGFSAQYAGYGVSYNKAG